MILLEVQAAINSAGAVRTFYLTTAAGGFTTSPTDTPPDQFFDPRIVEAGQIGLHAFSDGRTGGATKLETGEIIVANMDGNLDEWAGYSFDGRPVLIRVGEPGGAYPGAFPILFSGTIEGIEASFDTIIFKLRDKQFILDKPLLSTRYAGTNSLPAGLEGVSADLKGKAKPKAFGKVYNVSPPMVNTSRLILEVGAVASVDALYDRGFPMTAGAVYSSLAELESTAPASNQYRAWPAGGYVRLGSQPAGLVTVDLTEGVAVADRNAAQVLRRLALLAGIPAGEISAADVAALAAANPAVVGIWIDGDVLAREAMDQIAASVGAFYGFDGAGVLRMARLAAPTGAPVVSLNVFDYRRDLSRSAPRDLGVPIWRATVTHSKSWTVQASDLAGGVAADRRAFLALETRSETASDATIKAQWLLAGDASFDTLLTSPADAAAEAARLLALHKTRRDLFEATVPLDALAGVSPRIGDVVSLTAPRFGLDAGRLFRLIGFRPELARNQAIFTLWG